MIRTPMHNRFAEGFVEFHSSGMTLDHLSSMIDDHNWLDRDSEAVHRSAREARDALLPWRCGVPSPAATRNRSANPSARRRMSRRFAAIDTELSKRMVVRDSLLRACVAENSQLLLVLSTHVFFLSAWLWKLESSLVLGSFLEDHGFGDVLYLSAMMP